MRGRPGCAPVWPHARPPPPRLCCPSLLGWLQGADALVVGIDSEDTPEGNKDLFSVVQAVKVPVLARDWYIHPMQVGGMRGRAGGAAV